MYSGATQRDILHRLSVARSEHGGGAGDDLDLCRPLTDDGFVSKDSGLDLESDFTKFSDSDSDIVMRDPVLPGCGFPGQQHMGLVRRELMGPLSPNSDGVDFSDYSGGSLIKWRKTKGTKKDGEPENRNSGQLRNSLHWEDFFGSSVDLTPTLLGIYDKIASANEEEDAGPTNQSDCDYFVTNEFLNDGSGDRCHSPEASPEETRKAYSLGRSHKLMSHDRVQPFSSHGWDSEVNNNRTKMLSAEKTKSLSLETDNKKRPLSLSSMSSSSTSSLPRRRKRPNLREYSDMTGAMPLDIEKLDNLLYIDDGPDHDGSGGKTDEDSGSYSDDRRKSGGDTDSQTSTSLPGDQSEHMSDSLTTYQSDLSLSYTTPSTSANCSTVDLSWNSEQKAEEGGELPRRSPSRSSQKSGILRTGSASFKQTAHYVSYVQRVVSELVETEKMYVKHLEDIKMGYYQTIVDRSSMKIPVQDRECLFGNILEIYEFSCRFLKELEDCSMDPIKVAECFTRNSADFVIYADYCTNYPSAVAVLNRVMYDPGLNEAFKEIQVSLGHSLPLGAYLLKPVQRVLKYHLLLQNILKHYNSAEADHEKIASALEHMTAMSHQINEMKRKHEHAVRLQEIQSQLEDYEGEDFTRLGELVLEGSFRMYGVKASRQVFLFEKGIIIAKRKEDGMFSCKAYIKTANLMLVESIPREPLNFQIIPFDNPKGAHTLHARNLDQKRKWCQEVKRLILESYASKIPDSVKDLIIENMGKSKEEDDYAHIRVTDPGKSHVTTPDYLEKRTKNRRKSGAFIPEILKPQRARKIVIGRNRNETPSPKGPSVLENLLYNKGQAGMKSKISPLAWKERQENDPYNAGTKFSPAQKRGGSVQRSQSFQMRESGGSQDQFSRKYGNVDSSMSMDDLSYSEGSVVRTNSFRMATNLSPIRLEEGEEGLERTSTPDPMRPPSRSDHTRPPSRADPMRPPSRVLMENKNLENISPAIQKSIEKELDKLHNNYGARDGGEEKQDMNGSYLDEGGSVKHSRYASMPVLNSDPNQSPRMSRLGSSSSPNATGVMSPKSPYMASRTINAKPYFTYGRERGSLSPSFNDSQNENSVLTHVTAFNDAFSNLRKSQESLTGKGQSGKMALTQPKPFTSTLKSSASMLSSQARLNRWSPGDRFTKGSLSDLSHLKEDPWVKSKPRSYTESKLNFPAPRDRARTSGVKSPGPDKPGHDKNRRSLDPSNKFVDRYTGQVEERTKHKRTQSLSNENRTFSKENLDWLVYANRNSLPVSDFSMEEINKRFKYCTPPRGDGEKSSTLPVGMSGFGSQSSYQDYVNGLANADSSVSLSATATSSETCSSPDILKDGVFDDSSSAEKVFPHGKVGLSRSCSIPDQKREPRLRRQLDSDRRASADVLGDGHIQESEKLVEEMERYMKRSTSSSGSLSSTSRNRFPTHIPAFDPAHSTHSHAHNNRDSCISTGSASSYESADQGETYDNQQDEGLVDSLRSKFHNITSKFTGKKLSTSLSDHSGSVSPPSTPIRYRQEDHPAKLIPTLSHNLSLKARQGAGKYAEPDLSSILRQKEHGGRQIGERMANTDPDDYATFSLPRTPLTLSPVPFDPIDTEPSPKPATKKLSSPPIQTKKVKSKVYGRYSDANLPRGGKSSVLDNPNYTKFQSQSHSKLDSEETPSDTLNTQQSDSAFSIQSVENESSSSGDSPREDPAKSGDKVPRLTSKSSETDLFYERRLSAVFNSDDAFRDSAVYCDDLESPLTLVSGDSRSTQNTDDNTGRVTPVPPTTEKMVPTKVPIKDYVQHLEEKNKPKSVSTLKMKGKEPSAVIKQRIESLAANVELRNSSSNTSRSISASTSRAQSRSSSRASSEERQLSTVSGYGLKEFIGNKFACENNQAPSEERVFRSRSNSGKIQPAFSMSRLDHMNADVNNLVVMKGWVKELVDKFQHDK